MRVLYYLLAMTSSNFLLPTKLVAVTPPILNVQNTDSRAYAVIKGGKLVSQQVFSPSSATNSTLVIPCNPPDASYAVSRRVLLKLRIQIGFNGPDTPVLGLGTVDCLRSMPISQIITSHSMTINGAKVDMTGWNSFHQGLLRYHNDIYCQDREYSLAPAMVDVSQDANDWKYLGSGRNPAALFMENAAQTPRGAFTTVFPIASAQGTDVNGECWNATAVDPALPGANLIYDVTEPILIAPFSWGKGEHDSGLTGVNTMTYVATFGSLANGPGGNGLSRVWWHDTQNSSALTSVSANILSAAILCEYTAPTDAMTIPKQMSWPFFQVQDYPQQTSAVLAGGASGQIASQVITLDSIPQRLYIFAQRPDADMTYDQNDSFCGLSASNPITIKFDSNNYLSSASLEQLYDISARNGYAGSFQQWSAYNGSVLCVNFGVDIGLAANQAPGCIGKHTLQVIGNFVNLAGTQNGHTSLDPSFAPTLHVVAVYEGVCTNINGTYSTQQGLLTEQDVKDAKEVAGFTYKAAKNQYGGNWFTDAVKSVARFGAKALPYVKEAIPVAEKVISVLGAGRKRVTMGQLRKMGLARSMLGSGFKDEKSPPTDVAVDIDDGTEVEMTEDEYAELMGEKKQPAIAPRSLRQESVAIMPDKYKERLDNLAEYAELVDEHGGSDPEFVEPEADESEARIAEYLSSRMAQLAMNKKNGLQKKLAR